MYDDDEDDEPLYYVTWGSTTPVIEDDRHRYDDADWGVDMSAGRIGFLPPESEVETVPDKDEEQDDNTIGKPGMGKVVNGMKEDVEKELYADIVKENGYSDAVIIFAVIAMFVTAAKVPSLAPIMTTLATVLTVWYVAPR